MKLWVGLFCRDARDPGPDAGHDAPSRLVARTTNASLVRDVIRGLLMNQQLESDEQDILYDAEVGPLLLEATSILTAQIRTDAMRHFPKEPGEDEFAERGDTGRDTAQKAPFQ